ncbi:uncharacterized protein LOC126184424 [Schistocerca cancellata]|uniref:uncharacterized protein LOC126184424 n=1 Tax=Schistocerca cancellata TaxID=274614 RepID=UPI002118FDAA|nr:uncharacterized protein LOC126184424 [Schistocerca cancellata]
MVCKRFNFAGKYAPERREVQIPWGLGNEQQETVKTSVGTSGTCGSDLQSVSATPLARQIERVTPLPDDLKPQWGKVNNHLPLLISIHIERRVIRNGVKWLELHGFSDASEQASGTYIQFISVCEENNFSIKLLTSKSRVALIKQMSLPELDMCAALLLDRLMEKVKSGLHLNITKTFLLDRFYCGLNMQFSAVEDWNHVSSKSNPADIISRGTAPQQLGDSRVWWTGPSWLYLPPSAWPINTMKYADESADAPEKCVQHLLATTCIDGEQFLRVGGRLEQSKVSYSQKHLMILPPEHLRLLDAGSQLLLASLKQMYWIPNRRSVIRSCGELATTPAENNRLTDGILPLTPPQHLPPPLQ